MIGKHYGKHKTLKAMGTIWRALALIHLIRQLRPEISLCHGSRACLITSKVLNIPNITIADYEHTAGVPSMLPTWLIVPSIVPDMHEGSECKVLRYPGIKEDVYLPEFRPDATLKKRLGISRNSLLITIRPPATEAHYHNPEAEILLKAALDGFVADPETQIILLPRNERQAAELRKEWRDAIAKLKIVIPEHAEDGMNLIWNSDLVISGGGTMNREAAALGVPVYSIFRGKIGAVDRYLAKQGRLVLIERVEDVATRIKPVRRSKTVQQVSKNNPALETIVRHVVSIFEGGTNPPQVGN